jgi:HK97 family phage major capsid protein
VTRTIEDVLADQRAIVTASEGRTLSDDEATRYEALETEHRSVVRDAQIRARQAAYEAPSTSPVVPAAGSDDDAVFTRAFDHYLRTGQQNSELIEFRAQSEGTGTAGGFAVPASFRNKLVEKLKAFGGIASVSEEFSTGDGRPVEWPTLDDTANVGEIAAENAGPVGGADLVFGTKSLGAHKYVSAGTGGSPLKVPVELLQDSAFDIESLVARKLGERIARAQAPHLVSGTGVGQPQGITTGLTGVASIASTLVYSDFVNYLHAMDPAYLESDGVRWAMNFAALGTVRKILDSTGRPILEESTKGASTGLSRSILGYPVTIDQAFPNIAANSTTNWGVFGDLREGYVVRRVRDVVVVVNPYTSASSGQVEYSAYARMDACQQNTAAYVALTAHA